MQGLVVLAVEGQAVVDRGTTKSREDPAGVHRDPAAFAIEVQQRPGVVAGDVDPVQPSRDPTAGLIEVRNAGCGELLAGDREEPIQTSGCVG